jgi:hypothetical protein
VANNQYEIIAEIKMKFGRKINADSLEDALAKARNMDWSDFCSAREFYDTEGGKFEIKSVEK